jgi:hypothetical protein
MPKLRVDLQTSLRCDAAQAPSEAGMRARDRVLAENLIAVVAETGKLDDRAKVEALSRSWIRPPKSAKRAVAIVNRKLREAEMREVLSYVYDGLEEFTLGDAVRLHVAHIRGTLENSKASWPALKAFLEMILPGPD